MAKKIDFTEFFEIVCRAEAQCGKIEKFTIIQEKLRQINSSVLSLVKTLLSRNFCQRSLTVNFRNFHTVV